MSDPKVYPNPPIAMVAVEVRHSGADPVTAAGYATIRARLRKRWPVQLPAQDIAVDFGSSGPSPVVIEYQRFISRDKHTSIAIRPGSTTVETVDYKGWDDLRVTVRAALEIRAEVSDPSGYERIGLRYIDEVRVPDTGAPIDWSLWLHSSLLAAQPDEAMALPLSDWQGMSRFGPDAGRSLVLRYGPREGYAVEPNGPLKRSGSFAGPFFLLDIDSFWETADEAPEFDPEELMTKCDDLHDPVRKLFEGMITDRLRRDIFDGSK